jgi:uncharacterized membrane protein (DUF373 family)
MRTWSLSLYPILEVDPARLFVKGIKAVLSLMLGLILVTLVSGTFAVALELRELLVRDVEEVLRHILVGVLLLLAVIEVFKTTLAYLTEGRVKVTFIVDTILVVMLTEIIALWLKGGTWTAFGLLLGVIAALAGLRVMTIRFSPSAIRSVDAGIDGRG